MACGHHPLADPEARLTEAKHAVAALGPGSMRERLRATPCLAGAFTNSAPSSVLLCVAQQRGHGFTRSSLGGFCLETRTNSDVVK